MRGDGLRVRMRKIDGVTKRGVLDTPFYFQCPPLDDFSHAHGFNHAKYTTLDGEFTRRGGRNLVTTSFRTIIVEWGAFVTEFNFDVEGMVDRLQEISEKGYPFNLLCTHKYNGTPELHMDATLDSVTITETAGEQDARYIDLSFTEYRDPVVKGKKKKKPRRGKKPLPFYIDLNRNGTYKSPRKIPGGNPITLEKIAIAAYGKPSWAKHIAKANRIDNWGMKESLYNYPRFKNRGGKIYVPEPELVGTVQGVTYGIPADW